VGKVEARLMGLLEGVEFITVDKRDGLRALPALRRALTHRRFDVLLHLQLSLRASLIAALVRAPIKLGFDRARARELQWLFTNAQIAPRAREHVLDSFFGFAEALGVYERELRWDLPLPADALEYATRVIPDSRPTLLISPCSSHVRRNWSPKRYAAVADYAASQHGMRIVLVGGRTALEREVGAEITRLATGPVQNQIGQDTLPQLLALLSRARALLSPDSGPAHMATMVGTPVLGLWAATRVARTGPYCSRRWCIDAYERAARTYRQGRTPDELPWTDKIEEPGVMNLIEVREVTARLDELLGSRATGGKV
jgi:heptosyltransferase I